MDSVIQNLRETLQKTRKSFRSRLEEIFSTGKQREGILEDLMEALILSDVGCETAEKIIEAVRSESRKKETPDDLRQNLKNEILKIMEAPDGNIHSPEGPIVIMFVGVNGGGKTTSAAKMARFYKSLGKEILMVAADTFRAAAQEQLSIWGNRLDVPVITGQPGADPASVVFDAVQSFKARKRDILIIDTAGRIHTNINLMNELEKIRRILAREIEGAPHENLLVLDASIGQNALVQAREFIKFSGLTGIFLSKLDGTAKGGSVIGITDELKLPIKYVGTGEGIEDMMAFSPSEFVDALLS